MGPSFSANGVCEAIQMVARTSYWGFMNCVSTPPPTTARVRTAMQSSLYRRMAASGRSSGGRAGASAPPSPQPAGGGAGAVRAVEELGTSCIEPASSDMADMEGGDNHGRKDVNRVDDPSIARHQITGPGRARGRDRSP